MILVYLLIINALGFILMLIDKYKAKENLWRIPEKVFFLVAVLGGSIGCLLGMYAVRHKTKHLQFALGMPLILAMQVVTCVLIFG